MITTPEMPELPANQIDLPRASSATDRGFESASDLLGFIPAPLYTCDAKGRITSYNRAAVDLWGREPTVGADYWCGSWKIYYPDGRPMPPDECPMAVALRERRAVDGQEIIIERPDGERRHVLPHPTPLFNADAEFTGAINLLIDITERRRAEHALRDNEELYRRVVTLVPAAIYTCEAPSGVITFFNDHAAELWGRAPRLNDTDETFCGAHKLFLADGQPLPHDCTPMAQALREGRSFRNQEVIIERPDGTRDTVLVNIDPIRDESGRIIGAINVFHGITQIKEAQAAARDREERYELVLAGANAAIWDWDVPGKRVHYSSRWKQLRGYADHEVDDDETFWMQGIHPDDYQRVIHAVQEHFAGKTAIFSEEYRVRHKDGRWIWILDSGLARRDEHGNVLRMAGSETDITDRKTAERVNALLAAIVDSSDDAIISKNLDSIITSWNKGAERLFGYSADEVIGRSVTVLFPPEREDEEPRILERLKRGERVDHFETVRVHKNGTRIHVSLTISPVKDPQGRIIGASKIARDITERKRIEQELEVYRRHLQDLVEERSAELATAQQRLVASERINALGTIAAGLGHDIGNLIMPMAAHLTTLQKQLQVSGNGSNGHHHLDEHFQAIRKAFDYLRNLAAGLRMMAIDPAKNGAIAPRSTHLHDWFEENLPLLKTALTSRFRLEHHIPDHLPPVQMARHLLTQAVFNLIQNASQAMAAQESGSVRLDACLSNDRTMVCLSVSDTGPGMTEEVQRRCIEPFFTTKTRGLSTGLGLALVHGIVQDAGGVLDIQSELGRGSIFTLRIPVAKKSDAQRLNGGRGCRAVLNVQTTRLRAFARHALALASFEIVDTSAADQLTDVDLVVTDDQAGGAETLSQLLDRNASMQAVVFTDDDLHGDLARHRERVLALRTGTPLDTLRHTFSRLAEQIACSRTSASR